MEWDLKLLLPSKAHSCVYCCEWQKSIITDKRLLLISNQRVRCLKPSNMYRFTCFISNFPYIQQYCNPCVEVKKSQIFQSVIVAELLRYSWTTTVNIYLVSNVLDRLPSKPIIHCSLSVIRCSKVHNMWFCFVLFDIGFFFNIVKTFDFFLVPRSELQTYIGRDMIEIIHMCMLY